MSLEAIALIVTISAIILGWAGTAVKGYIGKISASIKKLHSRVDDNKDKIELVEDSLNEHLIRHDERER